MGVMQKEDNRYIMLGSLLLPPVCHLAQSRSPVTLRRPLLSTLLYMNSMARRYFDQFCKRKLVSLL